MIDRREAKRHAHAQAHPARTDQPAGADALGADHGDGSHGGARFQRETADAAAWLAERPGPRPGSLGEDHDAVTALENGSGGVHRLAVAGAAVHGKRAEGIEQTGLPGLLEQLALGHVVDGPALERADHEGIEEAAVVGREQQRSAAGKMLAPDPLEAEVDEEERHQHRAQRPVQQRVHALVQGMAPEAVEVGAGGAFRPRIARRATRRRTLYAAVVHTSGVPAREPPVTVVPDGHGPVPDGRRPRAGVAQLVRAPVL